MRKLVVNSHRICRECFLRRFHQAGSIGDAAAPSKSVPLRIFATEADSDRETQSLFRRRGSLQPSKIFTDQRYQDLRQAPSSERLTNDLRRRVGRVRPLGPCQSTEPTPNPTTRTRLTSRLPLKSKPVFLNVASPIDLLQPPQSLKTDTILAAINGCLSAAMERLELSSVRTNRQPLPAGKTSIPHDQFMWLCNILQFQFTRSQLVQYGKTYGLAAARFRDKQVANVIMTILNEVWNLEKEPELPPDQDLITKSIFVLSFMLMG